MTSEIQTKTLTYIPTVKWHQNTEYVYMVFEVNNAKNEVINISEDSISFFATSGDTKYEMKFDLFEDIDKDSSRYEVSEKHVKFTLKKVSDEERWNFVTKDRNIYKNNIKINWNEWKDESDDEEQSPDQSPDQSQFDFQKMMGGMGGMEGMGGMGGMEEMMKSMGGMGGMEEMMKSMGGMGGMEEMMKNMNHNDNDEDNDECDNDDGNEDTNCNLHEDSCECCSE